MYDARKILSNNGYEVKGMLSSGAHGDCLSVKENNIAYIIKAYKDNDKQEAIHEEGIYLKIHADGLGKDYLFKARHIEYDNSFFLQLDTYEGQTLDEFFSKNAEEKSIIEKIDVLINACKTISYLHRDGFLHMDIKLSNFYISNNGVIKPIDMGSAVELSKKEDDNKKDDTNKTEDDFNKIMEDLGYLSTGSYASFKVKSFNKLRNEYLDFKTDDGKYLLSDEEKQLLIDLSEKISVEDDIYSLISAIFKALTGLVLGIDVKFDKTNIKGALEESKIPVYLTDRLCDLFLELRESNESINAKVSFNSVQELIKELNVIKAIAETRGFHPEIMLKKAMEYSEINFNDIDIDEDLLTNIEKVE